MPIGRPDLALRVESATSSDRRGAPHSLITDLVVVTDSEEFQAALKQAVSSQQRIWRVPTTDQAADLLAAGRVGVLVIDTECVPHGAPSLITHLNLEFPDLVVVVAGTHEDVAQFAHLVGEGLVYRFLQKPVSPARVRAFIDAAVRRHAELVAEAPAAVVARRNRPRGSIRFLGLAILALAVVFGAYQFGHRLSSGDGAGAARSSTVAAPATLPPDARPVDAAPPTPITNSSLAPSSAAPREPDARDLAAIERAARSQPTLRQASAALEPARSDQALEVEAPAAVATPQISAPADVAVNDVRGNDARVARLVRNALLALTAGNLVEPEGNSAKSLLTNALKLDPENIAAQQAYTELQTQTLAQAQAAVQGSDPLAANRWIAEAQNLGVADSELVPLRRALDAAALGQRSDRLSGLARLAAQRLADDKLIEPSGDNARQYLKQLQTEDPALASPLWQQLAERMLSKAKREMALGNYDAADRWLQEADETGVTGSSVATVRTDVQNARTRNAFLANVVPSSQLKTKKYVAPSYPPKALSQGVEGWVDLEFTVDTTGAVRDIAVRHAVPTGAFEKAAVDALAKWRFEPVARGGIAVEQRSAVRIQFKLEQ